MEIFSLATKRSFPEIVSNAFSGIEYLSGVKKLTSSAGFDPQGFFFAEEAGSVKGCIGVFNLYRANWLDITYLAVTDSLCKDGGREDACHQGPSIRRI